MLRVTEKVVEAHFQMFIWLLWETRNWCFHSTAALIRGKILSLWDKFGFSAGEEEGKKAADAIWLLFAVTLSTGGRGVWGGGLPQKALTFTNPLIWHFIPINFKLWGKKSILFLWHHLHPGISPVTTWLISSLFPLWCTTGLHLFLQPYLNSSTHACILLRSCC